MRCDPTDGGCWFCHTNDEKEWLFCNEFDTYVHVDCLEGQFKQAVESGTDPETAIILQEFYKLWKCTNPDCGRTYAEYVNGCPSCEDKTTGKTWSVKEQYSVKDFVKDFDKPLINFNTGEVYQNADQVPDEIKRDLIINGFYDSSLQEDVTKNQKNVEKPNAIVDLPWRVKLITPTQADPFMTTELKVVDVGHSERLLICELPKEQEE